MLLEFDISNWRSKLQRRRASRLLAGQSVSVTCSGPSLETASFAPQLTPARAAEIVTALTFVALITSSSAFGWTGGAPQLSVRSW